jgi:hypothetical protein
MAEFVFMLTRDDVTIPDARRVYEEVADSGVTHFGCKDIGLPPDELKALIADIHQSGHVAHLEVVAETDEAALRSAAAAVEVGVDYLLGGTQLEEIQKVVAGSGIRFFPYIGQIVGHPCLLRGEIDVIAAHGAEAERLGGEGINLLAYRYDRDPVALVEAVTGATQLPVLCAGSVDSLDRVRELVELGVWGFTVGTAALDGKFVADVPLRGQLQAILATANGGQRAA